MSENEGDGFEQVDQPGEIVDLVEEETAEDAEARQHTEDELRAGTA